MLKRSLFLLVLLVLLWSLFRTGAGLHLLIRMLQAAAGPRVQLEGPSEAWPFRGRLARVALADQQGVWLTVSNLSWDLRVRDLLAPPFVARHVQADSVDWQRLPARSGASSGRRPDFRVDQLEVLRFRVASNVVAGVPMDLRVRGTVERRSAGWKLNLEGSNRVTEARLVLALQTGEHLHLRWDASRLERPVLGRTLEIGSGTLDWWAAERRGRYQVAGRWDGEPLAVEGALIRRPSGLAFPNMLVVADGIRGRISIHKDSAWQGEGRVELHDQGAWSRWLGERVDGEGRLQFEWEGPRVSARGAFPRLAVGRSSFTGVDWTLQRSTSGRLTLDAGAHELALGSAFRLEQIRVRAGAQPLRPGWQVELERMVARAGGEDLELAEPVSLRWDPAGLNWSPARINVAGGSLVASGSLASNLAVGLTWTGLPLRIMGTRWPAGWDGELNGQLQLAGSTEAPVMRGQLQVAGLRLRQSDARMDLSPADAQLDFRYEAGRAVAELAWRGWSDNPLQASLDLPLQVSFRPWRISVPQAEQGRAALRGGLDLVRLERFFDLRGTRVRGLMEIELDLQGSLQRPDIRGQVAVRDGQLDVPATGTSLRDLQLVLEGDRERLRVVRGSANDGAGGQLALDGSWWFDPARKFPVDAGLTLKRAELWRSGGSRAVLDGSVRLQGEGRAPFLRGQLSAPDVVVKLGRRRPVIPTLPVTGLADVPESAEAVPPPAGWRQRVGLELDVRVARTAEISGRGLESTWRANVQVGGTLAEPRVRGQLQAGRGYFLFMGRRFELEQAWIGLDGQYPPEPVLNLVATSKAADLVARLQASGPVREPVLELSSDPAFPPDEILSRLLFGKSADAISAFQAVRLAHGLSVLRGRGATLDVLDRGQSLLRVDQLDLRQDAEQGTVSSVTVGKYIGRRVFVQGETALDGSGDVIAVEVDLSPSLTLQTEASPGIREGIGLKWRRDY